MPGSGLGVDSQPYLTFQKLRHMWGEVDKREEKRQERETELALVRSGKGKRSWVEKEKAKNVCRQGANDMSHPIALGTSTFHTKGTSALNSLGVWLLGDICNRASCLPYHLRL